MLRHWCWERLKAGGEGDNRGWDGWMALPTGWAWVWASSGSWWWTSKPDLLQSMGSQKAVHYWLTELNWTKEYSGFSGGTSDKKKKKSMPANAGDRRDEDSTPELGRSLGGGNGKPLQDSCPENPMDRGVWGLQSIRSQRVGHDWSDLACTQHAQGIYAKCYIFIISF